MTPNERAVLLVNKYLLVEDTQSKMGGNLMFKNEAKVCALISVDEVLYAISEDVTYWEEVKKEIEKLPT